MNNKERFEIAIDYLKDIKPLKEICAIYEVDDNDLKRHGMEDEIKIPKGNHTAAVYHLTESNKVSNKEQYYNVFNKGDNYLLFSDEDCWSYNDKYITLELRYIEKANVFALCNYAVKCPTFSIAKVDFIGALIITPDKHTKLYKVKSQKEIWEHSGIGPTLNDYLNFLNNSNPDYLGDAGGVVMLNDSDASWNETFGKLFPLINFNKVEYYAIYNEWDLAHWIIQEEFRYKNTAEQKQINKLLKLPLKKVTKSNLAFKKGTNFGKRVFIERVKDDMICIRYFQQNDFTKEIFEIVRFYIDKKDMYFCQKNSFNQFIATPLDKSPDKILSKYFCVNKTIFDKSSSFEDTIIDYYKDIIESNIEKDATEMLLSCIYFPSLEKFWKEDYKEVIYNFVKRGYYSFDVFLRMFFGDINSSANRLRKILGINKYQLETIKQFEWDNQVYIIRCAKDIFGTETLPSLTNKQTDELFSILNKSYKNVSYYFLECFKLLREMYSLKTAFSVANDFITMQRKISEYNNLCCTSSFYRDYLTMVKELEMTSVYRPQFKDADDIIRMHDEVLEVYNVKKTIIENEKFAKRIETWKKFEYVGNDFSVVAPTKAEDLANEGSKLHHCVKSYIRYVTNGETNIVFIRKNTELEKPFFTVEITNDNIIQQVHGLQNRNADTEPGLTEFVEKWAKDKNLTLCDINKIR